MPLSAGTRLGPYEILAPLGAGGMGEVYRARDSKLDRDVAVKVLPPAFGSDANRMARFEREAKVLASLNHPNIAHIYGVEDRALVMELVDGESPAGPMPFDDAWKIALQIADALEYAHEKGVVHRDLKPANVKVTPEGVVKLLDFGLAKAYSDQPEGSANGDPALSPTITLGATVAGTILGTAAYMSPEQARGKNVDKRSDIWSWGVVLYELISGERLFQGEDIAETLAAVIHKQPDLEKAPPPVRSLLGRCLEKDPKKRLRDIGDARALLGVETQATTQPAAAPSSQRRLGWITAAVLAIAVAVMGYGWWSSLRPGDRPLVRLSADLGPQAIRGSGLTVAISPDGTRIVYSGTAGPGLTRLYTRRLDQSEATPLTGTDSAAPPWPFFSPDSQWIGFVDSGRRLRKVSVAGGAPATLAQMPSAAGSASWGDDGNIYVGSTALGLLRVPEAGGSPQAVLQSNSFVVFPQVLPGSKAVLLNTLPSAGLQTVQSADDLDIAVYSVSNGKLKTLLHGGYFPRYLPANGSTGYLVYVQQTTLFGVAFNPSRLEVSGAPIPLLEDVAAERSARAAGGQFDASHGGTLVYLSGSVVSPARTIQWLSASGQTMPLITQQGNLSAPRLSPDGRHLAYSAVGSKGADVWVYDLDRQTPTQVTFTAPGGREVAWATDSKHLVYSDGTSLWWIRADGSAQPQKILDTTGNDKTESPRPYFFASDGGLAYSTLNKGLPDIYTLPVDITDPEHPKPGQPQPFLTDPQIVEVDPAFSPDGKFLAYSSNESGAEEIYVRPFPGPGGKWKISTEGGKFPVFARATHQLFYFGGDDRIWVTDYTIHADSFDAGKPRVWSPAKILRTGTRQNFDISADGQRAVVFPVAQASEEQGNLHATFLFNFFDELRRRVK